MRSHQYEDAVIIGSALMHYSFHKAADLLGLGVRAVVRIPTDDASRMRCVPPDRRPYLATTDALTRGRSATRMDLLEQELERCRAARVLVLAVVGVAGTTETGAVDDLQVRQRGMALVLTPPRARGS